VNHSNFLADIVVGDAWLPSTLTTKTGISLIIARSPDARDEMERMEARGAIVLTEVGRDEILESQTSDVIFGEFAYSYADFLREQEIPVPMLNGPNRDAGKRFDQDEVQSFLDEYVAKVQLQRERRYRRLWWRKATKGMPQLIRRYYRWFTVRVLRIKSLRGDRQEISRAQLREFR
jgi:hypothetical protein